jgi:peroxiredoxin
LARLRDEYADFTKRGAEILAVGPDAPAAFRLYWRTQRLPFIGLPDPDHKVALRYNQEVNLLKLGRLPLVLIVDSEGLVRFDYQGASMSDIPANAALLEILDSIRATGG